MRRLFPVLLASFVVAAAGGPVTAQTAAPKYNVVELPLLTGAQSARPASINRAGQVVGGTLMGTGTKSHYQGWLWTPATATAAKIQALPPAKNFPESYACDINNAGQVVGYSYGTTRSATLWLTGAPTAPVDFNDPAVRGTLLPGWVLTDALTVSDPDVTGAYYVAGWGTYTNPATGQAVRWRGIVWKMQSGKMVSAAPLQHPDPDPANPEDLVVDPHDVNNLGQVAGDYCPNWNSPEPISPCVWNAEDGVMLQRPSHSGRAHAINENGSVAGEGTDAVPSQGFLWTAPTQEWRYLAEPGASQTLANALNTGSLVVGQAIYPDGVRSACLWQPQSSGTFQFYDLNKCKATGATRIALYTAEGVNDAGWIIGSHSNRGWRAFLLTPIK